MKTLIILMCSCAITAALQAQIIHVPAGYPTIQQGINAASPGDTILVAEGTYYEQISFLGKKPLMVASEYLMDGDTSHISNTIIDGAQLTNMDYASVVSFVSGEDSTSILCGFTIRNGKGSLTTAQGLICRSGGGIFIASSGAKIIHNVITGNNMNNTLLGPAQVVSGAGIGCYWSIEDHWVVIEHNQIQNNSCYSTSLEASGAGLGVFYNSRICGNIISNNTCTSIQTAHSVGAGLTCATQTTFGNQVIADVRQNIIRNNLCTSQSSYANSAGGLFQAAQAFIRENIVEDNEVITTGISGGAGGLFIFAAREGTVISNNTFRGNSSNMYGGGLFIEKLTGDPDPQTVLIENNYFIENSAKDGGAFGVTENLVIAQNNVFSGNHATGLGGAINYHTNQGTNTEHMLILANNSFAGNTAGNAGGAVFTQYFARPLIFNSIFSGDSALYGKEIYLTLHDTLEIANSDIDFSRITGSYVDLGSNINEDPMFSDSVLLTLPPNSYCNNSGTDILTCHCGDTHACPQYDILGAPRPWGTSGVDMGAYEYTDYTGISDFRFRISDFGLKISPNPCKSSVSFFYNVEKGSQVCLRVYDGCGRLVAEPVYEFQSKGEQRVEWNTGELPVGVYYCRLQAGSRVLTGKLVKVD